VPSDWLHLVVHYSAAIGPQLWLGERLPEVLGAHTGVVEQQSGANL
jgi:hypothetical protein